MGPSHALDECNLWIVRRHRPRMKAKFFGQHNSQQVCGLTRILPLVRSFHVLIRFGLWNGGHWTGSWCLTGLASNCCFPARLQYFSTIKVFYTLIICRESTIGTVWGWPSARAGYIKSRNIRSTLMCVGTSTSSMVSFSMPLHCLATCWH